MATASGGTTAKQQPPSNKPEPAASTKTDSQQQQLQLYGLHPLSIALPPAASQQEQDDPDDRAVDAVAFVSDRAALLLALVMRNHYITFVHARSGCVDESRLVTEYFRWRPPDDSASVTCACMSPSGKWLVLLLHSGHVEIVPLKMANMDITTEYQDPGPMPLFAEDEVFHLNVNVRDDGLQIPTCALWYETKNSRRPMLVCSNKGGDILFIDLLIRKVTISLQAPQSIHHLDVVEDIAQSDTYDTHLLVTGFASSQWLVPLETGGQSLRETLSHVVPSELKEVAPDGHMYSIAAQHHKTVGVLKADANMFEVYDSLDVSSGSTKKTVPAQTWLVHYTRQCCVCVAEQTQVHAQLNLHPPDDEAPTAKLSAVEQLGFIQFKKKHSVPRIVEPGGKDPVGPAGALEDRFSTHCGALPEDTRLLCLFPVKFSRKSGELSSFVLVCECGLFVLRPKLSVNEMFYQCLQPELDMAGARALCATMDVPLKAVATSAVTKVLSHLQQCREKESDLRESKLPSAAKPSLTTSLVRKVPVSSVVQLISAAQLPLVDLVPLFIASGHGAAVQQLVQQQLSALTSNSTKANEPIREKLSTHMFALKYNIARHAKGYQHLVAREDLRNFLLNNLWYAADSALTTLLDARMWDCVSVLLRLHDLNDVVMRHLLHLESWDDTDDFILLATRPNFACSFAQHRELSLLYLRRLLRHAGEHWLLKRHLIMLINMTNPARTEVYRLLNNGHDRFMLPPPSTASLTNGHDTETSDPLCSVVLDVFLHSFIRYVYARAPREQSHYRPALACGQLHSACITSHGLFVAGSVDKTGLLGPNQPQQQQQSADQSTSSGTEQPQPERVKKQTTPLHVPLPPAHQATAVACGNEHTLVLCDTGGMLAFGHNRLGQLGTGHRNPAAQPQPITVHNGDDLIKFRQIACGMYHNLAVSESGNVYTWGWAVYGQLGHGGRRLSDHLTPARVQHFVDAGLSVLQCGGGQAHSVVLTSDHAVYTFGCGAFGQIGCGQVVKKCSRPYELKALEHEKIVLLGCGQFQTLACSAGQRLYQWGSAPQALRFKAMLNKRKREANQRAGGKAAAEAKASVVKQLELEEEAVVESKRHLQPLDITADLSLFLKNDSIVQLSCGANHAAFVSQNGQLFTWGKSLEFQTGHGDKTERTHPTLLTAGPDANSWRYVACGLEHTMAVDRQGNVWAWGRNDHAQLGFSSGEQHHMAGRTITLERANRPRGVITLPRGSRSFCQHPTKLDALTLCTINNELPQCVCVYDSAALFDSVREWLRLADEEGLIDLAMQLQQWHLAAYILMLASRPAQALLMHARVTDGLLNNHFYHASALEVNADDGPLDYAETEATLECYASVVPAHPQPAERRLALARILQLPRLQAHTVQSQRNFSYLHAHWSVWWPTLFELLRHEPASMSMLSGKFKLAVIQHALQHDSPSDSQATSATSSGHSNDNNKPNAATDRPTEQRSPVESEPECSSNKQADNNNGTSYIEVEQDGLDEQNNLAYSFGGCGHFVTESTMQAQLARLQTQHRLNSLLPSTAACLPDIYSSAAALSAARLCPACLGHLLSQFANHVVDCD